MKTFIATAPAAYRPMIGAAIAIALADAGRDVARRADGRPTTVPESLLDAAAGVDDRILVLVLPYPNGTAQDLFQGIEDAVLAGQYDPAGSTPGMKQAVEAFRRQVADAEGQDPPWRRPYDMIAGRRIVSSTVEGVIAGHDDDKVLPMPVVFCDDGSVFAMGHDGSWRPRDPVPGTPAHTERLARIKASRSADDIEE